MQNIFLKRLRGETSLLIFDFDGVICDSFKPVILAINSLSNEYGFQPIPITDIERLRQSETKEIFQSIGIGEKQLAKMVQQLQAIISKEIASLKVIDGIIDVVKEFQKANIQLGIITSNAKANVLEFLKNNNIEFFDFIISSNLFNKSEILNNIVKEKELQPRDVFYVGDESRDIIACQEANVCSIAVTWGFNSKSVLMKHNPDYLFDFPHELLIQMLPILTGINSDSINA
jgi:HAD superfamily hydrolase (TIGR01549 family)